MLLHKSKVGTSLSYRSGNFTNNLNAENISLDVTNEQITLSVDLGCNLRVRNKQSNCYYDVNEYIEDQAELKLFQIDDRKAYEAVAQAYSESINCFLHINVGENYCFKYAVKVTGDQGTLNFKVLD